MYQHIMVPLDGSELAECVLSHVEMIANDCRLPPRITLIRVVAPLKSYSGSDYGGLTASLGAEQMERLEDENIKSAKDYLTKKVGQLKTKGINTEGEVIMGIVPGALEVFAERNNVDLIIIATHGRSGISRWVWGSVADKILRTAKIPVLMVRPQGWGGAG
jgi:nucleotide-binding universal stress UspA family protein